MRTKARYEFVQELLVAPDSQPLYVFKHKVLCVQLHDKSDEMMHQSIARIIQSALADHREPLAWRASENDIDIASADARHRPYLIAGEIDYAATDRRALWKVELVYCSMDRVDFNRRRDIKSSLLKAEA